MTIPVARQPKVKQFHNQGDSHDISSHCEILWHAVDEHLQPIAYTILSIYPVVEHHEDDGSDKEKAHHRGKYDH